MKKSIVWALFSALVFALGIPNELLHTGSAVAGFFSLVFLLAGFEACKNKKQASRIFGFWTALVHLLSSFWLGFFRDFAVFTLGATTAAYFFFGWLFGRFFYYSIKSKHPAWPFWFAAQWVFWEWFKSTGFLAYPWGTIPMTMYHAAWLKQIADITGVLGISFVIALSAATLYLVCVQSVQKFTAYKWESKEHYSIWHTAGKIPEIITLFATVIIIITCAIYSLRWNHAQYKQTDVLKIALIQPNSDSWEINFELELEKMMKLTSDLLKESKEPDIILWNEGTLLYSFPLSMGYYIRTPSPYSFMDFLHDSPAPLFAGTAMPVYSSAETAPENSSESPSIPQFFTNSVCLLAPHGEILDSYAKMHLVPFAEYVPFIEKPFVQDCFKRIVGFSSSYLPGRELKTFKLKKKDGKTVNFVAPICFEDAFADLCSRLHNAGIGDADRSQLMINLTDDSWSKTQSAEYQHFIVASFRTIELRTTLIRSTNSGYSCVVNPLGVVTDDLPLFSEETLFAEVPIYEHVTTFYAMAGDWFPLLCAVICVIGLVCHAKKVRHNGFDLRRA